MTEPNNGSSPGTDALAHWIGTWISRELKVVPAEISPDRPFVQYGMDSVHAMMLVGDLEEYLSQRLSPTIAWTYPTVDQLASYLASLTPTPPAVASTAAAQSAYDVLARLDQLSEEEIDRLLQQHMNSGDHVNGG